MSDKRICTLVRDRFDDNAYRVEYIDEEGGCEIAIFAGPNALDRAIHFAAAEGCYYDGWNDPEAMAGV